MPTLEASLLIFTEEPRKGIRFLRVSVQRRSEGNPSREHVGPLCLHLQETARDLLAVGQEVESVCLRNRTCGRLYDLMTIPVVKDLPRRFLESELRDLLAEGIKLVKLEIEQRELRSVIDTHGKKPKPERRERICAHARANGFVGVLPAAA